MIEVVSGSEQLRRAIFGADYIPLFSGSADMLRVIWIANEITHSVMPTRPDEDWHELTERLPAGLYRVKLRLWLHGSAYATEKLYADVDTNTRRVTWLGEYQDADLQPRPLTRREQRQRGARVRADGRHRPWRLYKKTCDRFGARHYANVAACRTWSLRQHPTELHEHVDALLLRLVESHKETT